MKHKTTGLAIAAAALVAAPSALAQPAVGVIGGGANDALATFDTDAPGVILTSRAVTGLVGAERLVGVDYRWIAAAGAAPGLYGLGVDGATGDQHLYRIDAATGVATPLGAGFNGPAASSYGFDFNPAVDRVRVTTSSDSNYRLHPDTGALVAADTSLTPAGQQISGVAYDRVDVAPAVAPATTPTTLYAINPTSDELVTQGGVNSTPSPNGGVLQSVGPLGVDAAATAINFDIAYDGSAFATLTVGGVPGLYRLDKTTGAATLLGAQTTTFTGFAIVPGTVQFASAAFSNSERSAATITVTRGGSTGKTATVNYTTGGGTAAASDYEPVSGTLTFAPGEASKSFAVEITQDSIREDEETVGLALSGPGTGILLGSPSAATLSIVDDDGPAVVAPPAADTAAPTIKLSTVRSSYSRAAFKKGITVRVLTNEPAAIESALYAKVTRATAARASLAGTYNLELTGRKVSLGSGTRTIKLRPKSALFGTPKKSVKVKLRVIATDAAGNARTVTKIITVKR